MSVSHDLIHRYPWLPSTKTYYSNIAEIKLPKFLSKTFSKFPKEKIHERILTIFESAFNNQEEISDYKSDELNVYLYLLIKLLLFALNDLSLINRIANVYSKQNYRLLKNENDYNFYQVCMDLNLHIEYNENEWEISSYIIKGMYQKITTHFRIHYIDFLKLARRLRDDFRKLVNNPLQNGYVFIEKKRLARFLQEYAREKLLTTYPDNDSESIKNLLNVEGFKEIYEIIKEKWKDKKKNYTYELDFEYSEGKDHSKSFPPCVKEILKTAQEGQNLNHNARLFIVWFLIALKYPVERIVNIFSTMPDFDREKTRYQVEFAKKKEYIPYSCDSLKSYDLCFATQYKDTLCTEGFFSKKYDEKRKIKHPLAYFRVQTWRDYRHQENNKQSSKQDIDINKEGPPNNER
ncbi:MAG: hypothetical protein ACTSR8_11315 [Promethearchaeota archaeon]